MNSLKNLVFVFLGLGLMSLFSCSKDDSSKCPDFLNFVPNNVTITNSTCSAPECISTGGLIMEAVNNCPEGSTLQYSLDNGTSWTTTVPIYNIESTGLAIITRCNCNTDKSFSSKSSEPMTTVPPTCPSSCFTITIATKEFSVTSNPRGAASYFSFEKGEEVVLQNTDNLEWDFGLTLITFVTNSGISGPGQGGGQIVNGTFESIKEAPESGYRTDAMGDLAITDEWYDYNSATRSFAPKAGKILVFRTANGKYAKMEVIKADPTDDAGNIVAPPVVPTKIKYTFQYAYQDNGSRKFE